MHYRTGPADHIASQCLHMHSAGLRAAGGCCCICISKIWLHQSMHVYWRTILLNFIAIQFEKNGIFGFFEECHPNNKNNNNKMSRITGSVCDPKMASKNLNSNSNNISGNDYWTTTWNTTDEQTTQLTDLLLLWVRSLLSILPHSSVRQSYRASFRRAVMRSTSGDKSPPCLLESDRSPALAPSNSPANKQPSFSERRGN